PIGEIHGIRCPHDDKGSKCGVQPWRKLHRILVERKERDGEPRTYPDPVLGKALLGQEEISACCAGDHELKEELLPRGEPAARPCSYLRSVVDVANHAKE